MAEKTKNKPDKKEAGPNGRDAFGKKEPGPAPAGAVVDQTQKKMLNFQLAVVSMKGDLKAAESLLDAGADVDSDVKWGMTPLMFASAEGHMDLMRLFLERGADVNKCDPHNRNALLYSVAYEYKENSPAEAEAHRGRVELLIGHNADPLSKDGEGKNAVSIAALNGHAALVRFLAEKGVPVNECDMHGIPPLAYASGKGHVETVEALVEKGADVNFQSLNGKTAIIIAVLADKPDVVRKLLDLCADPNLSDSEGNALDYAMGHGREGILKILAESTRS